MIIIIAILLFLILLAIAPELVGFLISIAVGLAVIGVVIFGLLLALGAVL
jgi:hypothetical protein